MMNTTLRRRSLLEMMACVVLVAALAVQPALGGDRKGKGSQQVTHKAATASKSGSGASSATRRDGTSAARRTTRQVAATPGGAKAAPAPAESTPPAADPATQPVPAVPAGAMAPEDGDSGTPPAAAAAPAAAETAAPSAASAPAADSAQRAPTTEAALPAIPTPTTIVDAANREIVQSGAPVVPSQVAGPATATADAAAVAPPAAAGSAPVPTALPSNTANARGTSAQQSRTDGGRAQARGRGSSAASPAINSTTGGTAPATALSEALRTPASTAIVRVVVRPAGGVQTSRPQPRDTVAIPPLQRPSRIVSAVTSVVHVVPTAMWIALAVLGALVLLLGAYTVIAAARTRRLQRQREKLMEDIGLLQAALLPAVPPRMGALLTTVAYRPADGPAAGGDFYDAFALPDGRVGLLLGDVSGHGRQALAKTTLVRFTVRAHLEAGMSPREAISIAGRSLDGRLADDFSTVLAAIHDPSTGTLTYASAGHPPPLVLGPAAHPPITASSAPPIGVGFPTGQRQTVLPMPEGTTVAVYSDGLLEARIDGMPLGSERLSEWLADLGPEATAKELLNLVVQRADRVPDDLAAIVLHAAPGASAPAARVEQLKLDVLDIEGPDLDGFLEAAGISRSNRAIVGRKVSEQLAITGGVIVEVRTGEHATVTVSPIGSGAGASSRQTAPIR
jgi:hypothetical protein